MLDAVTVRTCDARGLEQFVDQTRASSGWCAGPPVAPAAQQLHKILKVEGFGVYISEPRPEHQLSKLLESGRPLRELMVDLVHPPWAEPGVAKRAAAARPAQHGGGFCWGRPAGPAATAAAVRKTPSWPRSWANFSPL
jgi:hypothetical protein